MSISALTGGGHFVVLGFDVDAQGFQGQHHLSPQILEFVHGGYREVTFFVAGFVAQVGALFAAGVPDAFHGVDFVEGAVAAGFEADIVEDEEFGFRSDEGSVAEAGAFQVVFRLASDVSAGRGCKLLG